MGKPAKISVVGENKVDRAILGTINQLKKLGRATAKVGRGIKSVGRGIGSAFSKIRKLAIPATAAILGMGVAVRKAFDFELAEKQFEVLLGSVAKAKERFAELKELSAGTPFELKDLIEASKTMEGFGIKGKENIKTLMMLGDASAALDPDRLGEMALAFGRLFTGAQAGMTGEPTMRLLELKALAPQTKAEIDKLAKGGKNVGKIMALAARDMGRFKGGMAELSKTGHGLFSTLKDNWTITLATFGEELSGLVKGGMQQLIDKMKQLKESGTITKWAENAATSLRVVKDLLLDIGGGGDVARKAFADIGNVLKFAFTDAAVLAGNILMKAAPEIGKLIAAGFQSVSPFTGGDKAQAEKELMEEGVIKKKPRAFLFGLELGTSDVESALIEQRVQKNRQAALKPKTSEATSLKTFLDELSKRRGDDTEEQMSNIVAKHKRDLKNISSGMEEQGAPPNEFLTGDFKDSANLFGKIMNASVKANQKRAARSDIAREQVEKAAQRRADLKREEWEKANIKKDLSGITRTGIGMGELFDIKQFGFGAKGELGTKNNPTHVVIEEAPL